MLKTLRIPLIDLSMPSSPCFLEFLIAPVNGRQCDGLVDLVHTALEQGVELAKAALQLSGCCLSSASLRLITSDTDLSNSTGVALGLALTPQYLKNECSYQNFIVTGTLDGLEVGDSGYLIEKMRHVLSLGYQAQPTLFLLPPIENNVEVIRLYQALAENNIAVRTVRTLIEAEYYTSHLGADS